MMAHRRQVLVKGLQSTSNDSPPSYFTVDDQEEEDEKEFAIDLRSSLGDLTDLPPELREALAVSTKPAPLLKRSPLFASAPPAAKPTPPPVAQPQQVYSPEARDTE